MKVVKLALLGTAALAAVTVSARADDLATLKAQIEALNARISQIETTPSVPAGFQLMTIGKSATILAPGEELGKDEMAVANTIGIMPTADVPASTNIQWSGNVKAAIVYQKNNARALQTEDGALASSDGEAVTEDGTNTGFGNGSAVDVRTKMGLKVVATTDTAVGEVGVRIAFAAASNGSAALNIGNHTVTTDGYWGWWKITPELTLAGGVDGSLAGNGNGFDGKCSCNFAGGDAAGGYNHAGGDPSQIRLSYASGPISFAIALEDDEDQVGGFNVDSAFGVAGEMKWSGDGMGFELNAGYWSGDTHGPSGVGFSDAAWTVNAGANMALGDIANLSVAAGVGEDTSADGSDDRYTKASAFLSASLSDSVSAELGASHKWTKNDSDITSIGGGIYYSPVSQLTIGLEAGYAKFEGNGSGTNAALVTIYKF
jgi:hypothetical protein